MIRIGPAGNSDKFYAEGFKSTKEAFPWIKKMGLNAFEYSFGKGVRLREDTAHVIGAEAEANGVALSVHAPYFINFSNIDAEKRTASRRYLISSMEAAKNLGAKRCVFHPGACSNMDRGEALVRAMKEVEKCLVEISDMNLSGIAICPETMGKINQLGTLEEVIEICTVDRSIIPAIDFGHLYARSLGGINGKDDYRQILDKIADKLGEERMRSIHIHFSKIEYTKQGEKMHRTFAEKEYGPNFEPLAELILEYKMSPVIICESKGTMAEDAKEMLEILAELQTQKNQ